MFALTLIFRHAAYFLILNTLNTVQTFKRNKIKSYCVIFQTCYGKCEQVFLFNETVVKDNLKSEFNHGGSQTDVKK